MKTKIYRTARYALLAFAAVYVFLLSYPQILFAHEVSYKNFTVYARDPLDQGVYSMLDKVEAQLADLAAQHAGCQTKDLSDRQSPFLQSA
jgi:hypothetical protein